MEVFQRCEPLSRCVNATSVPSGKYDSRHGTQMYSSILAEVTQVVRQPRVFVRRTADDYQVDQTNRVRWNELIHWLMNQLEIIVGDYQFLRAMKSIIPSWVEHRIFHNSMAICKIDESREDNLNMFISSRLPYINCACAVHQAYVMRNTCAGSCRKHSGQPVRNVLYI